MTGRIHLDDLNSQQLDELYDLVDALRAAEAAVRAATLAEAIAAIEDPEQRALASTGLGLGWEAARDVLFRLADQ
ncbi:MULTISPECIES: hypothetical protein [Streptomyces]|uniref:hypothetical protein n=1 Tax=Streptomyces TaxID=1883 RepID=UPI00345C01E0